MPPRDWRFRIEDMLEAIEKIQRACRGLELESFRENELIVDAVLRNLAVIGEAARHVPDEVVAATPGIPWANIRGMRNVVVHEYFGVDLDSIWETTQDDLPPLLPQLRRLLET